MFKDYVVQLLCGVQNVTYIQRNYLHTVIAVDNTQIMGNVSPQSRGLRSNN